MSCEMVNDVGFRASWVCRTAFERARFLDLHQRLLPLNTRLLLLVLVVVLPFVGSFAHPAGLVTVAVTVAGFGALQRRARAFPRPELWVFTALLGTETGIAIAVLLTGTEHTGGLAMLLWPACGASARFRSLAAGIATGYAAALMIASELGSHPGVVLHDPLRLSLMLCALICATTVMTTLRHSDEEHRGAAVIDQLTGMLNRSALQRRAEEIEEQSKITGQPVGLIVVDIDRFKAVNDEHGHAEGDSVLRAVAYVIRRELRAYDLAYRLGGEEFAIVLLGADEAAAAARAEQLCRAVADEAMAGREITISLGVSATAHGEPFVWEAAFARADAALYAAKAQGRNRVVAASDPTADLVAR